MKEKEMSELRKQMELNFGQIFTFKDSIRKITRSRPDRGSILLNTIADNKISNIINPEDAEEEFILSQSLSSHHKELV
mgnify:FL=1|tara:strand:+ start:1078 stop:1311 length:234 start_codon:yes stop_codon:yes gene_type:complete